MGRQIILSEQEKINIQKMYGLISEKEERPGEVIVYMTDPDGRNIRTISIEDINNPIKEENGVLTFKTTSGEDSIIGATFEISCKDKSVALLFPSLYGPNARIEGIMKKEYWKKLREYGVCR